MTGWKLAPGQTPGHAAARREIGIARCAAHGDQPVVEYRPGMTAGDPLELGCGCPAP